MTERSENLTESSENLTESSESCTSDNNFDETIEENEQGDQSSDSRTGTCVNLLNEKIDCVSVEENIENNATNVEEASNSLGRCECSEVLTRTIRDWIDSEKNVPHDSVDRLLSKLNNHFSVPKCVKTLANNNEKCVVSQMAEGEYIHFDTWTENLKNLISKNITSSEVCINLSVNIDGIPLSNSHGVSMYTAYPILVRALEVPHKILCTGIYCSTKHSSKEMPCADILLKQFMQDISLLAQGIETNGKLINVKLKMFICDSPVRAAPKNRI